MELKLIKRFKKIDWKYVKHWLGCTIKDIPSNTWYIIRFHYIGLIAFCISTYILFFRQPYGDFFNLIIGFIILIFGLGFDMKNNTIGMY
jgi:hypothetical protein